MEYKYKQTFLKLMMIHIVMIILVLPRSSGVECSKKTLNAFFTIDSCFHSDNPVQFAKRCLLI